MSGYMDQDKYWGHQSQGQYNFDASAFEQPNQQFEFQTYDQQSENIQNADSGDMFNQDAFIKGSNRFVDEEEEPPLLEELGIDIDRILQKTLAVLNPFHRRGQIDDANYLLQDSDLAGPITFCLILAAFLSIAASKAYFGHIYGLAVISCILMYILLVLMSNTNNITFFSVASILGYSLLPVVALAGFSVFIKLQDPIGFLLIIIAVTWATLSASRFLSTISGEMNQRLLIAYPCALLYGTFSLIVYF
ncbi:protein YIPF5 homolog [Colletes gigas]|uniref:protein YIPF5 homolog n=1 Tax=Colletes gigas TaxID=935657 RepID=UPI001C9A65E2|nr:protein YIPF5 homolog [Colletes gigas]